MKTLILAAGYGTRLYPLIKDTPKALIDIQGQPLINHILERVKSLKGLNEIMIVTNDKFFGHFEKWVLQEQKELSCPITIVNDGTQENDKRLGSVGDIAFVLEQKQITDDLLVVGGDNLFDYSLDGFVAFASAKPTAVTIGLYDIGDYEKAKSFGVVALDTRQKVVDFQEKPSIPQSTLIAMCCYYFPQKTLGSIQQYLQSSNKTDRAGDYIKWLSEEIDVFGFKFSGKWYDIGNIESYQDAQKNF